MRSGINDLPKLRFQADTSPPPIVNNFKTLTHGGTTNLLQSRRHLVGNDVEADGNSGDNTQMRTIQPKASKSPILEKR